MGNYEQLKTAVEQVIKQNGNEEITGVVLQNALKTIISTIGENKQFVGLATPTTTPGTPDGNVFYIASTPGDYPNFNVSGGGSIKINEGEISFLWNGTQNWAKIPILQLKQTSGESLRDVMSQKAVSDLVKSVYDYVDNKPLLFNNIPVVRETTAFVNFSLITGRKHILTLTPNGVVSYICRAYRTDGTYINIPGFSDTAPVGGVKTVEYTPTEDFVKIGIYFGQLSASTGATVNIKIEAKFTIQELNNYLPKTTFESMFETTSDSVISLQTTTGALIASTGAATSSATGYLRTTVTNSSSGFMLEIKTGKQYKYTGEVQGVGYAGVCYYNENLQFIGSECTGVNVYNKKTLTPPVNAKYAGFCGYGGFSIYESSTQIKKMYLPNEAQNIKHVDGSVSISGDGSKNNPFKTVAEAITAVSELGTGIIYVAGGDYREQLNIGSLKSGKFSIRAKDNQRVRFLGSNKLTGWTKTTGFNNIYETPFTGTVPSWSRFANPIFEDGRNSKEIEPRHYHPLQKNLKYRLPFTPIYQVNSMIDCENTPGSYFVDGLKMYLHTSDSNNPGTNGYSYEVIARAFNTTINAVNQPEKVEIELFKLQFMFGTQFIAVGFYKMVRKFCVALACNGAGAWRNDTGYIETWFEEAGFCNGDGENSHFSSNSQYPTFTDNRTFSPTVIHNYLWTHDNGDDGESSHELHNVVLSNGLFEFNGDSGSRPSNDATYNVYNCLFRNNGWEVGTGISRGGEGFAVVNPVSSNPNTVGCRAFLYNCISEENNIGYSTISSDTNVIELVNCISRNNKSAEIHARQGKLISRNTRATNSNPAKIKVQEGTGIIEILNDEIVN